jgi:hypothetical protein
MSESIREYNRVELWLWRKKRMESFDQRQRRLAALMIGVSQLFIAVFVIAFIIISITEK